MNCPNCEAVVENPAAKFCISCGTRLEDAPEELAPEAPPRRIDVSVRQSVSNAAQGAEVTGLRVGEIQGEVHIRSGQVVLQASEATSLKLLESISTEVRTQTAAGIAGAKVPERIDEANGKLDTLLTLLREREARGERLEGVSAAGEHISRVDLLLKKASLLKIQAEQMMLDQVERRKGRINLGTGQVDLAGAFSDFDSDAYDAKLEEAKALLDEARRLDPTNTEVLLHLAELLTQITEDDPSDERRLLYEVQSLVRNPRDDTERFRLAQATFLLAMSHDPVHFDSLRDARDMFRRLGRTDWERHCDDLLRSLQGVGAGEARETTTPAAGDGMVPEQFNPVGNWHVQVMDALGSTMQLSMSPEGGCIAAQQVPVTGMTLQASGQWAFSPFNRFLQVQGMINGFQPFMLGIAIQGWHGGAFHGVGTDGIAYILRRV